MKIYMSYWSNGYLQTGNPFILNCHKLSFHYLKQNYDEVHLVTDTVGKDFLKDIPYTTVNTDLDSLAPNLNWAMGKLYTYNKAAQAGDTFVHVDYDVFAKQPFPIQKVTSSVLVQSVEMIKPPKRWYDLETFYNQCPNHGLCDRDDRNDIAYNTGIFGGTDFQFIQQYATEAMNLSTDPQNQTGFQAMNQNGNCYFLPTIFCEQYYLHQCAKHHNVQVTPLFDGGDFDQRWFKNQCVSFQYSHLNDIREGHPKDHPKIVELVNINLRKLGVPVSV
jgi:hypothetical protein